MIPSTCPPSLPLSSSPPLPSLPSPHLSSPTLPFLSSPHPFLSPFPLPPLRSRPLSTTVRSGERCKLPQRGLGRSHGENRIWCILALKSDVWWHQFTNFPENQLATLYAFFLMVFLTIFPLGACTHIDPSPMGTFAPTAPGKSAPCTHYR